MTDAEYLAAVTDDYPEDVLDDFLELRREGRIQIFDDGSGEPLIALIEQTN